MHPNTEACVPVLQDKRSHHNEEHVYHNWRKPVCGNEDPVQPKINLKKNFLIEK